MTPFGRWEPVSQVLEESWPLSNSPTDVQVDIISGYRCCFLAFEELEFPLYVTQMPNVVNFDCCKNITIVLQRDMSITLAFPDTPPCQSLHQPLYPLPLAPQTNTQRS